MSKFDFEYMFNNEEGMMVFNKEKWTEADAINQAIFEFGLDDGTSLHTEKGYAKYGFYMTDTGDLINGWHLFSCGDKPIEGSKRGLLEVIVIK